MRNVNPDTLRNFTFYQTPVAVIEDEEYHSLTPIDYVIYGMLLRRAKLSIQNPDKFTLEDSGEMFFYYKQEDLMEYLRVTRPTISASLKRLEEVNLLKRREERNGMNRTHKMTLYLP